MSDTPNRFDDRLIPASGVHDFGADESDDLNMTVPASATAPTTTSLSLFFDEGSPAGVPSASNYDATPGRAPMRITLDELDITGEQKEPMLFQISMTGSKEAPIGSNDSAPEETQGSIPVKGLEVIDEDNFPPPCNAEIEAIAASRKKLEVVQDDNNPPVPFRMEGGSNDTETIKKVKPSRPLVFVEEIAVDSTGDSIALDIDSRQLRIVPSQFNEVYVDTDSDLEVTEGVSLVQETINNESADSPIHVLEAFLVEETGSDDIVIATVLKPPRSWWRQRRVQFLLAIVGIVVMGFAIYIWDSRKKARLQASLESFPPTTFPSSSPTTCAHTITKQKITLTHDNIIAHAPNIAVDGMSMIIVVRDGASIDGRPIYAQFYSLVDEVWQNVMNVDLVDVGYYYSVSISGNTVFIGLPEAEGGVGTVFVYEKIGAEWESVNDPFRYITDSYYTGIGSHVAIKGDLALVAAANLKVLVFTRENGKWMQIGDVDGECSCSIEGDTIAVTTWDTVLSDWVLALHRHNDENDVLDLIQEPFPAAHALLSGNYLAFWEFDDYSDGKWQGMTGDGKWDLFMYHREGANRTYTFLKRFNIYGGDGSFSFDADTLVVGGDNSTHVFTLEVDGNWEETITLNRPYEDYYVSGRSVFAKEAESIFLFDIEDCVTMAPSGTETFPPSLTPSLSFSPSISPTALLTPTPSLSILPTISPSVSFAPSSTSSPSVTCYWVNITVVYDNAPWETAWYLQRIVDDQEVVMVTWDKGVYGKLSDTKYICLQEGEYSFIAGDLYGDGMCCAWGFGHYIVTASNDTVVEGSVLKFKNTTYFTLPFVESTSSKPSIVSSSSVSPSSSRIRTPSSSSLAPSFSSLPTETCYEVEITVEFGAHPEETWLVLWQMVDFGSDIEVFTYETTEPGYIFHSGPICLRVGMYWLRFYSNYREGRYNVTTLDHGELITEGEGMYFVENTIFSIPYKPAEYS